MTDDHRGARAAEGQRVTALESWIDRIEREANRTVDAQRAIAAAVRKDTRLTAHERAVLLGRCETYIDDLTGATARRLLDG